MASESGNPVSEGRSDVVDRVHSPQVGTAVLRREDERLVRGQGRFIDDVSAAGELWLRVVRSPFAHATITSIDTDEASRAEGVHLVLTASDVESLGCVPLEEIGYHDDWPQIDHFRHPVLATDRVRYVGEPVAAVIADSPHVAEDAAELILVDYEPLPVVLDAQEAVAETAVALHGEHGNESAVFSKKYGDAESAFETAVHIVSETYQTGRHSGVPLETRGILVVPDKTGTDMEVWGPQHTHDNQRILAAMLGVPLSAVHMRHTDYGGSFGVRGGVYPEYPLTAFAALTLGRPVKWIEDRAENLVAMAHSRQQTHSIAAAFDHDGRILGLRDEIWHDHGAYLRQAEPLISDITVGMVPGPYRVPAYDGTLRVAHTNKTPVSAYRAPGRYEGTFARERLLDLAADKIGLDRAEIRRRNLLCADDLPWEPGLDVVFEPYKFDSGDVAEHLDEALDAAGWQDWVDQAAELRAAGRLVGNGIGVLMDKAGLGLYDTGAVEVDPTGRVRVLTGATSVGQGIETVLAQIVADVLEIALDQIDVVHGDTDLIPDGVGSWSSRSTVIAGSAARNAALKTVEKAKEIASHLLEASAGDIVLANGRVHVSGSPAKSLALAELAASWDGWTARLNDSEPGLGASAIHLEEHMNYPYGVTLAQIELDPTTGAHELRRFFTSCEAGRVINPMTTLGQVIGAAVQGIGGALYEEFLYDEEGQPLCTTFMDYLLPAAEEMPDIECLVTEKAPTADNPLGAKGIGEVGLIAAGAAIAGAVDDALAGGPSITTLPITPQDIWRLAQSESSSLMVGS